MKTFNLKIIFFIFLLFEVKLLRSQSLSITGKFLDKDLMIIAANYTLVCEGIITVTGRGEEISTELKLNKNYKLTVGNNFSATQVIVFSTKTDIENNFNFDFELILNAFEVQNNNVMQKKLFVCFNPQKKAFDYNRIMVTRN